MMSQDTTPQENMYEQERANPLEQPINRQSKRRTKWILGLILIFVAVAGFFIYQNHYANRESTDDAQIDGHINPVAAKASGHVVSIYIEDNQFVKAGTVIEQAESARGAAMKDVETARARFESAQARVRETQANYTKAVQDLDRMKMLIAKDEISKQQYDAAVAIAAAAQAAQDSAKAGVNEISKAIEASQARVGQAEARIKEAQANLEATRNGPQQRSVSRSNALTALARVQQAQAVLEQAELNLQYTDVKAPIDGIVSQRKVELGQYVQIGQPLLALVPLHNVWVTANYKENQLKDMRPGQKAVISVDAYGGRKYEGHIDSIAAATGARFSLLPPENATGNYVKVVQRVPVKITIDKGIDDAHPLRPGLSVIATVMTREK
jgi:membrane fusion protein (multidrug efflux system)